MRTNVVGFRPLLRPLPLRDESAPGGGPMGMVRQLTWRVLRWLALSEQRRKLAALDERMLADIGVNPADANREIRRWFWDDPQG